MTNKKVLIKVPASTANLGPGFDTLGMALNLYAWIEMSISTKTKIHLYGDQMKGIPINKSNLVYKTAQQVFKIAGLESPELEISMYSDIPLTRGLGSSASAIIGALVAANALLAQPFSTDHLFQMASSIENHPDNVGASLFGGIVVAKWDGKRAEYIQITPDSRLEVLVIIPEFYLETKKARHVLPKRVLLKDAIFNVSHSSLLVAALSSGRLDVIKHAMKDRLHQPFRSSLIPGMNVILNKAVDHGALGIALSGAGPTMLALVDRSSHRKQELEQFLMHTLAQENVKASTLWLDPCQGVEVMTNHDQTKSLLEHIKGEKKR